VPALSVVIAAHDAATTLPEQLAALLAEDWASPWEIVVVDNASTDATAAVVTAVSLTAPVPVRLVPAVDGRGPAYARNVGAAAAAGTALAFCDADDVIAPGWVAAMGDALADHEFAAGPVELTTLNPPWLAGIRGSIGTDAPPVFDGRVPFASSCNLGIRRDRFLALGGFDEGLLVGEDIELSMRLRRAGVDLTFVPGALVRYRLRPDLRANYAQAVAYGAARPVLAERWRALSGEEPDRRSGARNWAWLVRHAPDLRTAPGRAHWVWVAGQRVGSLRGSWRVRRLYL
jgi:glycosyltransferase involved in cell wall biosynthesis